MIRLLPVLPALMLAMPASAAGLSATLAAPAPAARIVVHETLWRCTATQCDAARTGLRSDANECRALARKLGTVARFTAGDAAFDAAALDRCNGGAAR